MHRRNYKAAESGKMKSVGQCIIAHLGSTTCEYYKTLGAAVWTSASHCSREHGQPHLAGAHPTSLKSVLMFIYSRRLKAGRWPDHGRWHKSEYWPFMRSSCPSPRNILLCSTKDQTWSLITYDRIFGGNSCMQRNFFSRKNWCLSKVGLSCLNRLWIWENL